MGTTMEDTVAREQTEYEQNEAEAHAGDDPLADAAETDDEATQPDPDGNALFDAEKFETEALALPRVDTHGVTKIGAAFGGAIFLDRSDPADVALIRDLHLGTRHTLLVDVIAGPATPGWTTNKGGDLDVVRLTRKFVVQSVSVSAADMAPAAELRRAVRRLLDSGLAMDEVEEMVTEAAETSGRKHAE